MAEGSKDPCISHVDASHGEWPRIESSLLFCNFFYIVKIIEESLFSEGEIGFTRKKTSKTRNRYFFWIFWHFRHFRAISLWKKQGPFHPWSFWWGLKGQDSVKRFLFQVHFTSHLRPAVHLLTTAAKNDDKHWHIVFSLNWVLSWNIDISCKHSGKQNKMIQQSV
jgi:hypothetical protein